MSEEVKFLEEKTICVQEQLNQTTSFARRQLRFPSSRSPLENICQIKPFPWPLKSPNWTQTDWKDDADVKPTKSSAFRNCPGKSSARNTSLSFRATDRPQLVPATEMRHIELHSHVFLFCFPLDSQNHYVDDCDCDWHSWGHKPEGWFELKTH